MRQRNLINIAFNDISGAIAAPESHKDLQEEPLKAVLISKSA